MPHDDPHQAIQALAPHVVLSTFTQGDGTFIVSTRHQIKLNLEGFDAAAALRQLADDIARTARQLAEASAEPTT